MLMYVSTDVESNCLDSPRGLLVLLYVLDTYDRQRHYGVQY